MIVTCRSRGLAVACLVGALASAAAAAESAADRSLMNVQLAAETLRGGLADGVSAEDRAARGLKAEELLSSARAGNAPAGAVDASGSGQARRAAHGFSALAKKAKGYEPGLPGLPPQGPEKPKGFFDGIRQGFNNLTHPAALAFGHMGKAKRIATLVGLLALEAAAIIYPYQVVGVAMTALGAVGLFGTARELIGMFRRGK